MVKKVDDILRTPGQLIFRLRYNLSNLPEPRGFEPATEKFAS